MADDKVISLTGGPNQAFSSVLGEDGESFRFDAGVKYATESVPKSVLAAIEEGLPGHEFVQGASKTVENKLEKAREQQQAEEG